MVDDCLIPSVSEDMVLDREKGREGCRMEGGGWVFMDGHEKGGGRMHSDDLPGPFAKTIRQ